MVTPSTVEKSYKCDHFSNTFDQARKVVVGAGERVRLVTMQVLRFAAKFFGLTAEMVKTSALRLRKFASGAAGPLVGQEIRTVKQWLKCHRSDFEKNEFEELAKFDLYDSFFLCDRKTTSSYHAIAARFLSVGNLNKFQGVIRDKSEKVIQETRPKTGKQTDWSIQENTLKKQLKDFATEVFMECLVGCQGNLDLIKGGLDLGKAFAEGKELANKELFAQVFAACDPTDKSMIFGYMRSSHTDDQIRGFIVSMLIGLQENVPGQMVSLVSRLAKNPKLQKNLYTTVEATTVKTPTLCPELLGAIAEELRFDRGIRISRGDFAFHTGRFAQMKEIVGPNPSRFDASRWQRRMTWTLLPWLPFGAGPHVCPGWRLYQYLSALFIEVLVRHYQVIESRDALHLTPRHVARQQ